MSVLDALIEIIDVPSVTGAEDELCSLLERRYSHLATRRVGNSLIVGEPDPDGFYALYGHIDTVPVQGDPTARIEGDNLVGLGASDMKSGIAVMMELLEDASLEPVKPVVYVFYAAEEGPMDGNELGAVLDAFPWLTEAQFSVVLEPTDLNVEIGCNGAINADVVFTGKSAHSARPWLGENAVTKAGSWLASLHDRQPEVVDIDGLEYREVFTVTMAAGGIANNIIPPEFTVNLNYRFPPIYSMDEAIERLHAVAADAHRVVIKDRASAGAATPSHPEVVRLQALAGGARKAKQGWTDVARLTDRGAVAVNFGPGIVAQAHQVGEYVPIDNLDAALTVMRRFLAGVEPTS